MFAAYFKHSITKTMRILIFGGTGFVGTTVVEKLAHHDHQVVVATRNRQAGAHLQPFGNVGQIVCKEVNTKKPETLAPLFKDIDVVINLIGILYQKKKNGFKKVHTELPQHLAQLAKENGVKHFVQMSALGVDHAKKSKYAQSKLAGEQAVLNILPDAMIIRPSIIFGEGDGFFSLFNGLAKYSPALPLVGGGKTKFQPVYVGDVAEAIVKGAEQNKCGVYELAGNRVYSFKRMLEIMLDYTNRKRLLIPIPMSLAKFKAFFWEQLPKPILTRDQVELLKTDNIITDNSRCKKLADLGITPTPMETVIRTYL